MKAIPHVALLIETSNAYCRELLQGIAAYVRDNRPWSIYLSEHERGAPVPKWLRRWKGGGIIARVENERIASAVVEARVPVVNVSSTDLVPTMPSVVVDEEAQIQLAGRHLLDRGFDQFAFCGTPGQIWSESRAQLFLQFIRKAGGECHIYGAFARQRGRRNWEQEQGKIVQWLENLPKPIGLLASDDFRGQQVLDACGRAAIFVPEQVAVASLGDDPALCDLTLPPMTSVTLNAHRAGYLAASKLDRLMAGKLVDPRVERVEPFGIHLRQSTDVTAIQSPEIVTALQMIRRCACEGIKVEDVLAKISWSRRLFEQQFKKLVGRTPHEEIVRVRIDHAKRLLAESELNLSQIATHVGFRHASYMSEVFRKKTGITSSQYREKFQKKPNTK